MIVVKITDYIKYIYSWNQAGIIISKYDISLLQLFFFKNIVNLKEYVAATEKESFIEWVAATRIAK